MIDVQTANYGAYIDRLGCARFTAALRMNSRLLRLSRRLREESLCNNTHRLSQKVLGLAVAGMFQSGTAALAAPGRGQGPEGQGSGRESKQTHRRTQAESAARQHTHAQRGRNRRRRSGQLPAVHFSASGAFSLSQLGCGSGCTLIAPSDEALLQLAGYHSGRLACCASSWFLGRAAIAQQ